MVVDVVKALVRWSDSGGIWRVVAKNSSAVTLTLLTCDGGEEMQQIHSCDPKVVAWIGNRSSSKD